MDNEDKIDRRKYERFPFREDIQIDGSRMCTSMDISEIGLYISAMQSYENNNVIDVAIPFKGGKLTVKAQVRHCQPGIGMGVMFVDLTPEQKADIKELIESIANKSDRSDIEVKNILLVEDNSTSRQAIKSALCKEGFSVIEASDGIEAIKFLAGQQPDLIILDLYMKGMDGLKVLSIIKTDPNWKELPVIVCSGHDAQDMKEKVMNAGAAAFLPKSGTSPAKLARYAKTILQQRHKT